MEFIYSFRGHLADAGLYKACNFSAEAEDWLFWLCLKHRFPDATESTIMY